MNTTTTTTAAPRPQGLSVREIPGGLAVVGHPHRTYKARRELKARGALWNATARQWEATTPTACDALRHWLTDSPTA